MLKLLHIENVAVIERADIDFSGGFNVMTGETGAGKSIVIDALGAVLGIRMPRDLIRTGAGGAAVSAVFDLAPVSGWCEENGVSTEDGELLILRRITQDGKNTCRVNGCPVTVAQLRELGMKLLDIHGQNDGARLLDEKNHLAYLDAFGELGEEKAVYAKAFDEYSALKAQIESLTMDENEKARRIDMLTYQISEIESVGVSVGEADGLKARRELMKNSGRLSEAVSDAFNAIYGGDRYDGAITQIEAAERAICSALRYSDRLEPLSKALSDLKYSAGDAAEMLRDLRADLDFSPDELEEVENRLDVLKRVLRKYGPEEADVLRFLEKSRAELNDIEYSAEKLERLEIKLQAAHDAARKAAKVLSGKRRSAAKELEKRITDELSALSMPGVMFEVGFEEQAELTKSGMDDVSFLMSANAGEKVGKISRIASGGELARIMLAMKNVLVSGDDIGSMVFDEIDTGVSGIAAQRVGEKLAALAANKQVICVTHLPQIAVMADTHFAISKSSSGGRTYTSVEKLGETGRIREIARLTGGENITDITLTSAKEQLEAARRYREGL